MLDLIKETDMVLHGIGTAEEMAKRRIVKKISSVLREKASRGESFRLLLQSQRDIVTPQAVMHYEWKICPISVRL